MNQQIFPFAPEILTVSPLIDEVHHLDELSLNAWPTQKQILFDGWLIRLTHGFSKRANSVMPLYAGNLPLDHKIQHCETLYHQQHLPALFRLTSFTTPPTLDATLAQHGYTLLDPTYVQLLNLIPLPAPSHTTHCRQLPREAWLTHHQRLSGWSDNEEAHHQELLSLIVPPAGYFVWENAGHVVTCAIGVVERGYLGIFDVVTGPAHRRQGFARQLMPHLYQWGKQQGAHTAYLQVVGDNTPARLLYEGMGFTTIYTYWYRIKPHPSQTI